MSTWISRLPGRAAYAALAVVLALAGCMEGADVTMGVGRLGFLPRPPEKITVSGGSVVIAGPAGYCVDRSLSRDEPGGAFVLLGSCAALGNRFELASPDSPGLLTASVSPAAVATDGLTIDALKAFVGTERGRAALARDGNAGSVRLLRTRQGKDALYLYLRDTSTAGAPGLLREYWRGLFFVNGRVVTVTVTPFAGRPFSAEAGLRTIDAFRTRIGAENPAAAVDAAA